MEDFEMRKIEIKPISRAQIHERAETLSLLPVWARYLILEGNLTEHSHSFVDLSTEWIEISTHFLNERTKSCSLTKATTLSLLSK